MLLSFVCSALLTFIGEDPLWKKASVSAYAVNRKTGEVLLDEGGDKALIPASCVKVITTTAALSYFGGEAQFATDLEYSGEIDAQGVLHGNLYIKGVGDPMLGSQRLASTREQLSIWIEAIKQRGICAIEGEVIGEADLWEKALAVPSWAFEDLGNYYGSGASALSFHDNAYELIFQPGKKLGESAAILRTEPPLEVLGIEIHSEVKSGKEGSGDQACIYGSELSPVVDVRGTIPLGALEFKIQGAVGDPSRFCARSLTKALAANGIVVRGKTGEKREERHFLHRTLSPKLEEIVYFTNQQSVNLYAEHLLKKMGETLYGEGSTASGLLALRAFLTKQGVDLEGLHLQDGSGLSRQNLVSAKQFVSLLTEVSKTSFFEAFLHSLPEIGPGVRAKDGAMRFVRGYVGYAGDVAFAILVNQGLGLDVKKKVQTFVLEFLK